MRNCKLRLHDKASADLRSAENYYFEIYPDSQEKFARDFRKRIETVVIFPLGIPVLQRTKQGQIRRINFRDFPYVALYAYNEETAEILVLAVVQTEQSPKRIAAIINGRIE